MVTILMMSAKMATLGHLNIKVFSYKGYDVIFLWCHQKIDQKNHFFEGRSWFKFRNLGLALSMVLKF